MEKARNLGKHFLDMAKKSISREEERDSSSDEDKNPRHRRSYAEVVSSGEEEPPKRKIDMAARLGPQSSTSPRATQRRTPAKTRLYTEREVMEMLKKAQMPREVEGWTEVTSKQNLKKQTATIRDTLRTEAKKRKLECWNCGSTEHISRDCPKMERCRYCHEEGHRVADCPKKGERKDEESGDRTSVDINTGNPIKIITKGAEIRPNRLFVPLTSEMAMVKAELELQLGIAFTTSGNPTAVDIINGIKSRSDVLNKNNWNPVRMDGGILLSFPSKQALKFFCDRTTAWSCRNGAFRVRKWTGTEETRGFNFHFSAWIRIRGLPIYAWTRDGLIKILCNFGYVLEVDNMTLERSRLDFARVRVGSRRKETIPKKLEVVIDGRIANLTIEIEEETSLKTTQKNSLFPLKSPKAEHHRLLRREGR